MKDKELLLKDLCGRLPYGVKCSYFDINIQNTTYGVLEGFEEKEIFVIDDLGLYAEDIKPYLFPLSSMSERQCYELSSIRSSFQDCWKYIKTPIPLSICNFEQIEWLHKNHFDYRGLIPMGLALDATGLNIY